MLSHEIYEGIILNQLRTRNRFSDIDCCVSVCASTNRISKSIEI